MVDRLPFAKLIAIIVVWTSSHRDFVATYKIQYE